MNIAKYNLLKQKYSMYSSWAIWDYRVESKTTVIEENIKDLQTNYVLIALNASNTINSLPWSNFHGGKHDRKIKYACNHTLLRGSYITDLFKNTNQVNSQELLKNLTPKNIKESVEYFKQEMQDLGITHNTTFILFGNENSSIAKIYNKHFKPHFKNKVIYHTHYSYYGVTDEKWVKELWNKLNIKAKLKSVIKQYKKQKRSEKDDFIISQHIIYLEELNKCTEVFIIFEEYYAKYQNDLVQLLHNTNLLDELENTYKQAKSSLINLDKIHPVHFLVQYHNAIYNNMSLKLKAVKLIIDKIRNYEKLSPHEETINSYLEESSKYLLISSEIMKMVDNYGEKWNKKEKIEILKLAIEF